MQPFLDYRLRPVIHDITELRALSDYLKDVEKVLGIHLKVDTGMGRLGFLDVDQEDIIKICRRCSQIHIEGLMTHLARADEEDPQYADEQYRRFNQWKQILEELGMKPPIIHIANSASIMDARRLPGEEDDMDHSYWFRPGIMLYGSYPSQRFTKKVSLKPVMTLKTKLLSLKTVSKGTPISYGGTFVTNRESIIGVLPIGYADGYPRLLSNKGEVLVRGQRVPIVGRVCMDLTMVDLTDVKSVEVGDEAVLIGTQGKERITVEEVADWAQTIGYEILCGLTSRVPRKYIEA